MNARFCIQVKDKQSNWNPEKPCYDDLHEAICVCDAMRTRYGVRIVNTDFEHVVYECGGSWFWWV